MSRDRAGHFAIALFCSLSLIANIRELSGTQALLAFGVSVVASANLYYGLSK